MLRLCTCPAVCSISRLLPESLRSIKECWAARPHGWCGLASSAYASGAAKGIRMSPSGSPIDFPGGIVTGANLLGLGMPTNRPPPLTNVQIRAMFKDLNGTVTNLVLSMAVVHDLLVSKNYVTEAEVSAASEKIRAEAKDALAKMHKSHRRGPNGGEIGRAS